MEKEAGEMGGAEDRWSEHAANRGAMILRSVWVINLATYIKNISHYNSKNKDCLSL